MTREEAKQAILEHMDAIQQILDRFDPERKFKGFAATVERPDKNTSRLSFWTLGSDWYKQGIDYFE